MGTATGGMYRAAGTALADGCTLRWALIIKVMSLGASTLNPANREIDHPLYWKREVLVYQSGLLTNLPGGVEAPRCLAVTRRPGDVLWLWLEEAHDRYGPIWPLEQYHSAARCLGRFNGTYLAGRPIRRAPGCAARPRCAAWSIISSACKRCCTTGAHGSSHWSGAPFQPRSSIACFGSGRTAGRCSTRWSACRSHSVTRMPGDATCSPRVGLASAIGW